MGASVVLLVYQLGLGPDQRLLLHETRLVRRQTNKVTGARHRRLRAHGGRQTNFRPRSHRAEFPDLSRTAERCKEISQGYAFFCVPLDYRNKGDPAPPRGVEDSLHTFSVRCLRSNQVPGVRKTRVPWLISSLPFHVILT